MPTFDFLCLNCDHVFEFVRPFGSAALPICPKCRSKRTEKLITPPTIQFKGTGFYKTDSRGTGTEKKQEKVESGADKSKEGPESKEGKGSSPPKESGAAPEKKPQKAP